ncbi:unnamed protein product [Durusdinium trenchii]|uniref:Uncharacterized protein n=2 Tax=Durusdinium trenchii TaxID=1381693 RepID=A0ABP0Q4E0_9DINO
MSLSEVCWESPEVKAHLVELAAARNNLAFDDTGTSVDTRSNKGCSAAEQFLGALETLAASLKLEPASRAYRNAFQAHFAELQQREYSVAVLEACLSLSRSGAIWANGQKFDLNQDAEAACFALLDQWEGLLAQLDHLLPPSLEMGLPSAQDELCKLLVSLDARWAEFEHLYILEIMRVQHEAKGLVAKAMEVEEMLSQLEEKIGIDKDQSAEYEFHVGAFVGCISQLNVAANVNRKTFDELTADVWENADALLKMCAIDPDTPLQAVRVIAQEVLQSFEELRQCLRVMRQEDPQLDDLNPQLCHNEDLVKTLMRWEEAWISGARYIQTRPVLGALCKLVPRLLRATQMCSDFASMCANFDAELFLVLPRIVWLTYFESNESLTPLISNLLPHRFVQVPVYAELRQRAGEAQLQRLRRQRSEPALGEALEPELAVLGTDAALRSIQSKFNEVKLVLQGSTGHRNRSDSELVWNLLLQSAVSKGNFDHFDIIPPPKRSTVISAVEDLMLQLESWSLELQRHCAEDWNECTNVLVKCLLCEQALERI